MRDALPRLEVPVAADGRLAVEALLEGEAVVLALHGHVDRDGAERVLVCRGRAGAEHAAAGADAARVRRERLAAAGRAGNGVAETDPDDDEGEGNALHSARPRAMEGGKGRKGSYD